MLAVFYHRILSIYLCIWSTLLGRAVLFPSDSDRSVNTISAPGASVANLATLSLDLATFQTPLATLFF